MTVPQVRKVQAAVIGAGPAGLMAAEQLAAAGLSVEVFEAKPTAGRKLLRAGIGGLNITHSENAKDFLGRYGEHQPEIGRWLQAFGAEDLRQWCAELGVDTFVGSSGRVFPLEKKAAPLLRRWLARLREQGARIHCRHRWLGWSERGDLRIQGPGGEMALQVEVAVLALGGGSWAALGSDGRWMELLAARGIHCAEFRPSNCGFNYPWSQEFQREQAGAPLKNIALRLEGGAESWYRKGDALIAVYGIEGSLVYAASSQIRDAIDAAGECTLHWDLLPDRSEGELRQALARRKPKDSLANVLRKQLHLSGAKLALFKALTSKEQMHDLNALPALLKRLPQTVTSCRPLDEAISTAGGVAFAALDDSLMLNKLPGVYCVGEMLDWEAPTGGYLLTACFASGVIAGRAAAQRALAAAQ